MLGDRQRDAGNVGLLEGVRADQPAADLPRDAEQGRRVEHRGGDAGHHVGGSRSRGRDRDADPGGLAPVAPAIAAALREAVGVVVHDLPMSPERVYRLMESDT